MVSMMANDKREDLSRMYKLFARVPNGHEEMRRSVSNYIEELAKAVNENWGGLSPDSPTSASTSLETAGSSSSVRDQEKDPQQTPGQPANPTRWVEEMLLLKEKFDTILQVSFEGSRSFQIDMNSSLERSINQNRKAPEFVSLFIDENLKKGLKGVSTCS